MICLPYRTPLYPINHLRNLAIQATETTHVANLDIDLIPSGTTTTVTTSFIFISFMVFNPFFNPYYLYLAGLYDRLCSLDFSEEKDKRIAYVISAFQFKYNVRKQCTDEVCFARLRGEIPHSTDQLIACMRKQECQIMNKQLTTYVCLSDENNWLMNLFIFSFILIICYSLSHGCIPHFYQFSPIIKQLAIVYHLKLSLHSVQLIINGG